MRKCGILLPVSSLPSEHGIGTFGIEAYNFIDFLKLAKQSYWQVLPLGPTSYGDSPYQSFSSFAGNPYFIDLNILKEDGLIENEDLNEISKLDGNVDYGAQYYYRFNILKKAYSNFEKTKQYKEFVKKNSYWLDDYALFMTLKKQHDDKSWNNWNNEYKFYNKKVLTKFYKENEYDVDFWKFIQFEFNKQWSKLKEYANESNIEIIGDIPIYVAYDSADVWSNVTEFQLNEDLEPIDVAGCPPDAFCEDGQLWGNPLYNYKLMKENNYSWWVKRMNKASELYDIVRIDHFRGFEAYYSIPYGSVNAKVGKWKKGPGYDLFKTIEQEVPNVKIIAEDLGFLTEGVYKLLKRTGYPGMKILEFAFDLKGDSEYMPHNYTPNCVVYTGTHDNLPLRAWYNELKEEEKHYVKEYLMLTDESKVCDSMIRIALASIANYTIIPLQDYLGLGEEARINTPSTAEGNWTYRIKKEYISDELALYIAFLTKLYRRTNIIEDQKTM